MTHLVKNRKNEGVRVRMCVRGREKEREKEIGREREKEIGRERGKSQEKDREWNVHGTEKKKIHKIVFGNNAQVAQNSYIQ